jgi:hypothetical protein
MCNWNVNFYLLTQNTLIYLATGWSSWFGGKMLNDYGNLYQNFLNINLALKGNFLSKIP